jgi:hypothetical protein
MKITITSEIPGAPLFNHKMAQFGKRVSGSEFKKTSLQIADLGNQEK